MLYIYVRPKNMNLVMKSSKRLKLEPNIDYGYLSFKKKM